MAPRPMRFDEFHAAIALLPTALRDRALLLRSCAVHRQRCPQCLRARGLLQQVFDANAWGEATLTESLLGEAEQHAGDGPHTLGCSRLTPVRRSPSGGHLITGIHGKAPCPHIEAPLVAATDASVKAGKGGLGYVVSDGRWGMRGRPGGGADPTGRSRVLVNELRAVALLLAKLEEGAELTLLVDSQTALGYLRRWQDGDTTAMPSGYDPRPRRAQTPTLVGLAERVSAMPGLRARHVQGHSGDPLNEAADALASMARRRLTEAFDARSRAGDLVESFILAWHRLGPPDDPIPTT